jgi:hypothetical protein
MELEFIPDSSEKYITDVILGGRWTCHPKTAAKRFKKCGGTVVILGGSTRYPLSQVIIIEREGVAKAAARAFCRSPRTPQKRA